SAVLLDLIQVFRNPNWRTANQQGALLINLRFATSGARERLRVFAIHELLSVDPPDETKLYEHENAPDGVGLRTIATNSAFTFDKKTCGIYNSLARNSERIVSGVCVPIRFLSQS